MKYLEKSYRRLGSIAFKRGQPKQYIVIRWFLTRKTSYSYSEYHDQAFVQGAICRCSCISGKDVQRKPFVATVKDEIIVSRKIVKPETTFQTSENLMNIHWQLFSNEKPVESAATLLERVIEEAGFSVKDSKVEANQGGGFTIYFTTPLVDRSWSSCVLSSLKMGQKIGRSIHIAGDIENELDAWSNEPVITGLTSIHFMLGRD